MSDSDSDHEVNNLLPKLKKTNDPINMNNGEVAENNKGVWKEYEEEKKIKTSEFVEIIEIENLQDYSKLIEDNYVKLKGMLIKSLSNLILFKTITNFKEIAQGGYSKIYKGEYKSTIIIKKYFKSFSYVSFLNELKLLKKLRHPNIPIFYGCFIENLDEILLNLRNSFLKTLFLVIKHNASINPDNTANFVNTLCTVLLMIKY